MRNRHHIIYPRKAYTSKIQRVYRNAPEHIWEVDFYAHRELHDVCDPVEPIPASAMLRVLGHYEEHPMREPAEVLDFLIEFMEQGSLSAERITTQRVYQKTAEQLRMQYPYIVEY